MQLYPAIDLKNGQCVRLKQGEFKDITVYSDKPEEIAAKWQSKGATFLHLVDLDGALAGHSVNKEVVRKIAATVSIPIQMGGGIRKEEDIEFVLSLGVSRVIIGTKAAENPEFIRNMVNKFGQERIVAGIDAKNGMVAVEGWGKISDITASDLANRMKEYGIRHVVYTDIARDGMLSGPNVEYTKKLTDETGLDIIASGGMSSMEDLKELYNAGIHGAIIGKALYENRIDLKEAIDAFEDRTIRGGRIDGM
ncbi:1-(5-phosphoribosyl)-5-[(5-phosphoribosylamino)methylideneamino]imidazole-4-carboxamide isomerase [Lacrimispora algidixylanolytica]|uniref:1-(5-phosphoribosyl)-5-[(5-phosphoribosylamino)methylideneamino] imidazole-4-carboxamide isomerase n=1 Tax=Lacrimispora algidixylanolytica TaxID=94868 RepID=A0A419STJ7_9FIRM|nr:1-(5-phosphoribosyl)-5-[(5-phosphoribosylamino)methylideneamino]imidazole-4-carboxamide isomerase [Lacrimispora algidixylanolytica]RKD28486.1 1-(5-phosphoribosyl)-5-[(5-phosphoribosylamino)methylideneamino]imidazole-4-carboxamide isomerase [Lacrimispora algidixylanolytica]